MRFAAKVDDNHTETVASFRRLGFYVLDISRLKNCCDLMVSRDGMTVAVEIKDGKKVLSKRKLSEGEAKFRAEWLGSYVIVESIEDVFKLHYQMKGMIV